MACDFHWLMCGFNDTEFNHANAKLKDVIKAPERTELHKKAINVFQQNPYDILPTFISPDQLPPDKRDLDQYENGYIENKYFIDFENAFRIEAIHDVALQLPLSEQNVLSWENYDSLPFAVLTFALGLDVSEELPGVYGNMLIANSELPAAISRTKKVFKGINTTHWERARRSISVCSAGNIVYSSDKEITLLFNSLLKQMRKAKRNKSHFMALSFWMG